MHQKDREIVCTTVVLDLYSQFDIIFSIYDYDQLHKCVHAHGCNQLHNMDILLTYLLTYLLIYIQRKNQETERVEFKAAFTPDTSISDEQLNCIRLA